LSWGAGPRAVQYLVLGGKARALLYGRVHVQTDDIQSLAYPVLRHRILTNFTAAAEGITPDTVIKRLIEETPSKDSELTRVEGFITGMHKSPFFGHSVEFVQHREYTSGDDIRHLDWKVWSKTDRFYVKQFEAETNLRCTLVVDVSESMHYGRGPLNKYQYACTAGACLAYLLLRQQDAAGVITFDDDVRQIVPPRSQQTHIDALTK